MSYIRIFSEELIRNSLSDDYDSSILEWVYDGDRWKEEPVTHCICGHPIIERCLVKNRINGNEMIIGNCCIHKFGIEREHWNRSKKNFLEYALPKVISTDEEYFIKGLLVRLEKWPSLKMSEAQKSRLEEIAEKKWRWKYKWGGMYEEYMQ